MSQHIELTSFTEQSQIAASMSQNLMVMANLKAPEMNEGERRAPISVSAVIDRSGSMEVWPVFHAVDPPPPPHAQEPPCCSSEGTGDWSYSWTRSMCTKEWWIGSLASGATAGATR